MEGEIEGVLHHEPSVDYLNYAVDIIDETILIIMCQQHAHTTHRQSDPCLAIRPVPCNQTRALQLDPCLACNTNHLYSPCSTASIKTTPTPVSGIWRWDLCIGRGGAGLEGEGGAGLEGEGGAELD